MTDESDKNSDIFETVRDHKGSDHSRVKSSNIYLLGLLFLFGGLFLLQNGITFGGFMSLTLFPICMLYPLVRFLFGGKDSVAAVLTTVVVEEVLKKEVGKRIDRKRR